MLTTKTCHNCGIGVVVGDPERCPKCRCSYTLQYADIYNYSRGDARVAFGICSGHPMLADGTHVRTSAVLQDTEDYLLTYNTLYTKRSGLFGDVPAVEPPRGVKITSLDQFKVGSKLRYVGEPSKYYTCGSVYEVIEQDHDGIWTNDDRPHTGLHHWCMDDPLSECFVLLIDPDPSSDPEVDAISGD